MKKLMLMLLLVISICSTTVLADYDKHINQRIYMNVTTDGDIVMSDNFNNSFSISNHNFTNQEIDWVINVSVPSEAGNGSAINVNCGDVALSTASDTFTCSPAFTPAACPVCPTLPAEDKTAENNCIAALDKKLNPVTTTSDSNNTTLIYVVGAVVVLIILYVVYTKFIQSDKPTQPKQPQQHSILYDEPQKVNINPRGPPRVDYQARPQFYPDQQNQYDYPQEPLPQRPPVRPRQEPQRQPETPIRRAPPQRVNVESEQNLSELDRTVADLEEMSNVDNRRSAELARKLGRDLSD